jgi:hypothetical protein
MLFGDFLHGNRQGSCAQAFDKHWMGEHLPDRLAVGPDCKVLTVGSCWQSRGLSHRVLICVYEAQVKLRAVLDFFGPDIGNLSRVPKSATQRSAKVLVSGNASQGCSGIS